MLVYNYNPLTKEYIGSEEAQVNPLSKEEYLIPAHSTTVKPPKQKNGYALVWIGNKWTQKVDHRGEEWYNAQTKQKEIIDFIGELPEYYYPLDSVIANPPEGSYWVYDNELNQWVGNPVLYKLYISENSNTFWQQKMVQPFEFKGYRYIAEWRELYTSIWTTLRDGIKNEYRLADYDGKFNVVNIKSMKEIMGKMADVIDEMYVDKHNLEKFVLENNNFEELQQAVESWVNKEYK